MYACKFKGNLYLPVLLYEIPLFQAKGSNLVNLHHGSIIWTSVMFVFWWNPFMWGKKQLFYDICPKSLKPVIPMTSLPCFLTVPFILFLRLQRKYICYLIQMEHNIKQWMGISKRILNTHTIINIGTVFDRFLLSQYSFICLVLFLFILIFSLVEILVKIKKIYI